MLGSWWTAVCCWGVCFLAVCILPVEAECTWEAFPNRDAAGGTVQAGRMNADDCKALCKEGCVAVKYKGDEVTPCFLFSVHPVLEDEDTVVEVVFYNKTCATETTTATPTTAPSEPDTTESTAAVTEPNTTLTTEPDTTESTAAVTEPNTTATTEPVTTESTAAVTEPNTTLTTESNTTESTAAVTEPNTTLTTGSDTTESTATVTEPNTTPTTGVTPGVDNSVLVGAALFLFGVCIYLGIAVAILLTRKRSPARSSRRSPRRTARSDGFPKKNDMKTIILVPSVATPSASTGLNGFVAANGHAPPTAWPTSGLRYG